MKIFKRIYYPVMAALLVLMLVFGLVDATYSNPKDKFNSDFYASVNKNIEEFAEKSHNSYNPADHAAVRDLIVSYLSKSAKNVDATKDDSGYDVAEYYVDNVKRVPTFTVQNTIVTQATMDSMDNLGGNTISVNKEVNNIIAAIPGTDTINNGKGKAIIMTAHYDSVPVSVGATDNGVAVAALLENFKYIVDNQLSFKNDLIFVFTDAEEEGLYGSYAFKYQFKGFDNVYSRAELGANFSSFGTGGTMLMLQTSKNNSKLVSEYAKINGATFTSSMSNMIISALPNSFSDFNIYGDMLSLEFANVGELDNYHTSADNVANVSQHIVKGQANAIYNFYNHFGGMTLSSLNATSDSVYFSYLDIMTIVYPIVVSFVIAGAILGLLLAIILVNKKKKAFSWGKVGGGIAVQLVTVLATILVLFVGYFAVTLLLSAFGVIPISSITALTFSSVGLMVSVLFFAMAVAFTFYILLKKAFNVKAADVVRGNAVILGVAGAVLSLALPQAGYLLAFIGFLSLVVMFINVCLKDKFKAKTGMDIERLFLYVWPVVICLPLIIPPIVLASSILSALFIPVIAAMFVLVFGGIAPYFDYVKPVIDKGAQKLPMRTIRVERTVTERIEDKAKKGKFTEETRKKVTNEKIHWRYLNRFGISVIAVLSFVAIMCFTSFGGSFSSNIAGSTSFTESVYNDSLVYVWDKTSGTVVEQLVVKDHMAYKYISRAVSDLNWSSEQNAYVKAYSASSHINTAPTVTKTDKTYTFNVYDNARSAVTIKLTGTKNVDEFTFTGSKGETVTYTNNDEDERIFNLPYGYGKFSMTTDVSQEITIEYSEYRMGIEAIASITDWVKLLEYYAGEDIYDNLRGGIVLKYSEKL